MTRLGWRQEVGRVLRVVVLFVLVVGLGGALIVQTWLPHARTETVDEEGGEQDDAVAKARDRLREAQTEHTARVRAAELALKRAQEDVEVLIVGPVVLGRCAVVVCGRERELTEGTRFEFAQEGSVNYRVDEEGESSRIVPDDRRTGGLFIVGTGWQEEVPVVPVDFYEAERLVAAGDAVVRTLAAAQRERADRVRRAWADLEEARAARSEVDDARLTLEDLQGSGPWVWDVPEPPEEK